MVIDSYSQVSLRHFISGVKYGIVALSYSIVGLRWVVAYVHHFAFIWVETKQPLMKLCILYSYTVKE